MKFGFVIPQPGFMQYGLFYEQDIFSDVKTYACSKRIRKIFNL